MADIVERIRVRAAVAIDGLNHAIPVMNEAAEEIERLRAKIAAGGLADLTQHAADVSVRRPLKT